MSLFRPFVRKASRPKAAFNNAKRKAFVRPFEALESRVHLDATFLAAAGESVNVQLSELFAGIYLEAAEGVTVDNNSIAVGSQLNLGDSTVKLDDPNGTPANFADDVLIFSLAPSAGQYNFKVDLLPNGQPAAETVHITVAAPQDVAITPTVLLTAGNTIYNGSAYAQGNLSATVSDGAQGTITYKFYSGTTEIAAPVNAGAYSVQAFFTSADSQQWKDSQSGLTEFTIAKADASISVQDLSVTYTGTAHSLTGTATGIESPSASDLSSLLNFSNNSRTNAGVTTVGWSFAGNENYNSGSGTATLEVTAISLDDFASALTQSALNIAKDGTVSFAINVTGGIVDGQTVAQLFNNAQIKLSMKTGAVDANGNAVYESKTISASANVIDGIVYVNLQMNQDFYTFLKQALDSGETSASKASLESITLSASSLDGNYTLVTDALTRIFQAGKVSFI